MRKEDLVELFVNWKGLELTHITKSVLKVVLIILSLIFTIISIKINNTYILVTSLVIMFLQILSENNQEYYLKYKEIYNKVSNGDSIKKYEPWLKFLERTSNVNFISKVIIKKWYKKEIEKISINEK